MSWLTAAKGTSSQDWDRPYGHRWGQSELADIRHAALDGVKGQQKEESWRYLLKHLSFCHEQRVPFPGDPTQPVHRHCLEQCSQQRWDVTGGAILPQARALQESDKLRHPLPWRDFVHTSMSCEELMAEHGTCYSNRSKPGYEAP